MSATRGWPEYDDRGQIYTTKQLALVLGKKPRTLAGWAKDEDESRFPGNKIGDAVNAPFVYNGLEVRQWCDKHGKFIETPRGRKFSRKRRKLPRRQSH